MLSGYLSVAIFFALIVAFGVVSLVGAWAVRPSRPSASKSENYECGAQPIGEAWIQFPVGFYLVALIFLVFDTLAVFLFPWALTIRALGGHGLAAMRERTQRLGGVARAGPTADGWLVELEVPA